MATGARNETGRGVGVRRALLGAGSLALSLAAAELAARGLELAPPVRTIAVTSSDTCYVRSTNPILGYEIRPDHRDPTASGFADYPSTNAHGQRDVERRLEPAPGTTRVLLLGDSVVEGHGLRDVEDTLSRRLEALCREAGEPVEVLNFGVSGYCTRAEVELLRVKGLAFRPDVVLLVFVENDFVNFNPEGFQLEARARPAAVEALFGASTLFRAACLRWDLFQYRAETDPVAWNKEAIGDDNVVEGLDLLAALSREHGFEAIVAVWPLFTDEGLEDAHFVPGGDALIVEALARRAGLPAVRLSELLREPVAELVAAGESPRERLTVRGDRLHPSAEGARVGAAALKRVLDDRERLAALARPAEDPRAELAVESARRIGDREPSYALFHYNQGNDLLRAGRVDEAIEHYERALALAPHYANAHYNLGGALVRLGRLAEAIEHYRRAVMLEPEREDARESLAEALRLAAAGG